MTPPIATSRTFRHGRVAAYRLHVEAFNLLNNFNWGNPNLNFLADTFGRITDGRAPAASASKIRVSCVRALRHLAGEPAVRDWQAVELLT